MSLNDLHTAIVEALAANEQTINVDTILAPGEIEIEDEDGNLYVVRVEHA